MGKVSWLDIKVIASEDGNSTRNGRRTVITKILTVYVICPCKPALATILFRGYIDIKKDMCIYITVYTYKKNNIYISVKIKIYIYISYIYKDSCISTGVTILPERKQMLLWPWHIDITAETNAINPAGTWFWAHNGKLWKDKNYCLTHNIHAWHIYLHLVDVHGTCR